MANIDYAGRGSGYFSQVLNVRAESGPIDYFTEKLLLDQPFMTPIPPEYEEFVQGHALEFKELMASQRGEEPPEVGAAAFLGDEIVKVTEVGPDYLMVARGCADTVPAHHGGSSQLWFFESVIGSDYVEYAGGETVAVKVLPKTAETGLPIEKSPPTDLTFDWRFTRPYPPGQMQQNGEPWFMPHVMSADEPALTLSWVHRNRVTQADQLVDHHEASVDPEPGTTYWVEVYAENDPVPRRTEVGLTGTTWTYQWSQAIVDLDIVTTPDLEDPIDAPATIVFGSMRDGHRSWQTYSVPFSVNNQGLFLRAASLSMQVMQESDDTLDPLLGVYSASLSMQTLQEDDIGAPLAGVFVSQLIASTGQETSLYTPLSRLLFEAPYTYSLRAEGYDPVTARVLSVAGRPTDRLTDYRLMYSRPKQLPNEAGLPFETRHRGGFTPWALLGTALDYLSTESTIVRTSMVDGIPLTGVVPGQMALIDAEVVRIDAIDATSITLGRGCADTTPRPHTKNTRIWFFEVGALVDKAPWPRPSSNTDYFHLEYKIAPEVIGPPLELDRIPTDRLALEQRKWRPFPPGRVTLNGQPWFKGAFATPDQGIEVRWVHRNRLTQGGQVVQHSDPNVPVEPGVTYKLSITASGVTKGGSSFVVRVREAWTDGDRFDYTYAMAYSDGFRVANLLGSCGGVSVQMRLDAYRDGLDNWQGYSFWLRLPAPACPSGGSGNSGGGGAGGGQPPGRGNGDNGDTPDNPPPPPPDPDEPPDPIDPPIDPGDDGPLPPEDPPPDWPDDIDPPPTEWPGGDDDETPQGSGRWDMSWDQFWAARADDDPGDDEGQD